MSTTRTQILGPATYVAEAFRGTVQSFAAFLRRIQAHRRKVRQAHRVYQALSGLDDRTLRDLGMHRSELASIATEAAQGGSHGRLGSQLGR